MCNQLLLLFTPGLCQTDTLLLGVHWGSKCEFSMMIIIFTEIMTFCIRSYFNNIFSSWNQCCVINSWYDFPSSLKHCRMLTHKLTICTCHYEPALKYDYAFFNIVLVTILELGNSMFYWFSKWTTWNNWKTKTQLRW